MNQTQQHTERQAEQMRPYMDYPIGDEIVFDGDHLLQVVIIQDQRARCSGCFFDHTTDGSCQGVKCLPVDRTDGKDVIYKKIDQ